MRHPFIALALCSLALFRPAHSAGDINWTAFEASSAALHKADAETKAREAAVQALSPRLKRASHGERAGAHIGTAGACAIDVPVTDINTLSSLAMAEAILGKPLTEVPLDGGVIATMTAQAGETPEAVAALRQRQQRAKNRVQAERDFMSRYRAMAKKINPQAEPADCRNLRAHIDDLLSTAQRDGSVTKAEVVEFAVEEIQRLQTNGKR